MVDKITTQKAVAEFLGTATLSAVVLSVLARTTFPFFVALGAGLSVGLMTVVIGKISGAHVNPAITLGFLSKKMIEVTDAIMYIAMQLLGAFLALGLYQYLSDRVIAKSYDDFDWRTLIAEAAGAFVFGLGVMAAVRQKLNQVALGSVIGLSLLLGLLVASAGSSGILNPAVALGLKSFTLAYIVGPVVGVIVGMFTYDYLASGSSQKKK